MSDFYQCSNCKKVFRTEEALTFHTGFSCRTIKKQNTESDRASRIAALVKEAKELGYVVCYSEPAMEYKYDDSLGLWFCHWLERNDRACKLYRPIPEGTES